MRNKYEVTALPSISSCVRARPFSAFYLLICCSVKMFFLAQKFTVGGEQGAAEILRTQQRDRRMPWIFMLPCSTAQGFLRDALHPGSWYPRRHPGQRGPTKHQQPQKTHFKQKICYTSKVTPLLFHQKSLPTPHHQEGCFDINRIEIKFGTARG